MGLLKLAFVAVVGYIAWSLVRGWFRGLGSKPVQPQQPAPPVEPRAAAKRVVEDTSVCAVCGAYVSSGAAKCSRFDCPLP
ncbi:MAG: hypothetical protein ACHQK9_23285 [Reyranellales bacterium]